MMYFVGDFVGNFVGDSVGVPVTNSGGLITPSFDGNITSNINI